MVQERTTDNEMSLAAKHTTAKADAAITTFVCANCARSPLAPSAVPTRPKVPDFGWPFPVEQVLVPCTGTVQPEHLLKAIEAGADLVCVIACEDENCHRLEGSRRIARRLAYVGRLLDEVGLGSERVMLTYLPGSSRQDMALGAGLLEEPTRDETLSKRVRAVRDEVIERLATLGANPLKQAPAPAGPVQADLQEVNQP